MRKTIKTDDAPKALGPYSQGIAVDDFCFVSMELGIDPQIGKITAMDVKDEAKQVIKNVENILKAAEFGLADVVKTTLYLSDLSYFKSVNEIYGLFFNNEPPARAAVVTNLPLNAKVALDAIAYKK